MGAKNNGKANIVPNCMVNMMQLQMKLMLQINSLQITLCSPFSRGFIARFYSSSAINECGFSGLGL